MWRIILKKELDTNLFNKIKDKSYKESKEVILEQFEKEYFIYHLKIAEGNISNASKNCEMTRHNFYQKIEKYRIDPKKYKI